MLGLEYSSLMYCHAQEGLLQDRLLSAKKKRDRAEETAASFEACTECNCPLLSMLELCMLQVKTSATIWRKRMSALVQLCFSAAYCNGFCVCCEMSHTSRCYSMQLCILPHTASLLLTGCGKPPSMIGISQARNLDDVAALLRDLYRRNARLLACSCSCGALCT